MRLLVASLILVTLATLIGFGWALDLLFVRTAPTTEVTDITDWSGTGRKLAHTLDRMESTDDFISNWPADTPIQLIPSDDFPLPEEMRQSFAAGQPLTLESDNGVSVHHYLSMKKQVLVIGPTRLPAEDSRVALLFTAAFYIGVLLLLLFWIYPLIRRLLSLEQSARQFGQGDLSARVSRHGVSYIGQIEREFNRMANRIQTLVADNKLLSSAVSHELRTPIARLRFGIDALSDTADVSTCDKYISRISSDIELMEKLVNSLLHYAKLDNQLNDAERTAVDLQALIPECLLQYGDEPVDVGFVVEGRVGESRIGKSKVDESGTDESAREHRLNGDRSREGCIISGNADYIAMLINNLISNAMKYAESRVQIRLYRSTGKIHLDVADDGPGIEPDKRKEILKPFQRLGDSRQNGYGLGLAIVARIASAHEATLDVGRDRTLGGAVFFLAFPKVTDEH